MDVPKEVMNSASILIDGHMHLFGGYHQHASERLAPMYETHISLSPRGEWKDHPDLPVPSVLQCPFRVGSQVLEVASDSRSLLDLCTALHCSVSDMVMDLVMSLKVDEHSFDNVCLALLAHALIALKSPAVTAELLDVIWNKLDISFNWGCPMPDLIKAMSGLPELTPLSTLSPVDEGDRSMYDCPLEALATVYATYPSLAVYLRPLLAREIDIAAGLLGETPVASRVLCLIAEKYPDMESTVSSTVRKWLAETQKSLDLTEGDSNPEGSPLYLNGSGKTSTLVSLALVSDSVRGSSLAPLVEGAVTFARETLPWHMNIAEAIVRVRLDTYPLCHRVCMRMPAGAAMEMLTSLPNGCLRATDGTEAVRLFETLAKLSLTAPAHLPVWIEMCPQLPTMTNTPVLDLRDMSRSEDSQSLISFLHATPSVHVLLPQTLTGTIVSVIRDAALGNPVTPLSGVPLDLQMQMDGILPCQYRFALEEAERQCSISLVDIPDSRKEAEQFPVLDPCCVTESSSTGESVHCLQYNKYEDTWATRTLSLSSLSSGEPLPKWTTVTGPSLKPQKRHKVSVTLLPIGGIVYCVGREEPGAHQMHQCMMVSASYFRKHDKVQIVRVWWIDIATGTYGEIPGCQLRFDNQYTRYTVELDGRLILVRDDVVMALEPHVSIDGNTGEVSVSGDWVHLPPCPESLRPILDEGDTFVSHGKLHILPSREATEYLPGHLSLSATGSWETLTNWRTDMAPGGENPLYRPSFVNLGSLAVATSFFPVPAFDLVSGDQVDVMTDGEAECAWVLQNMNPRVTCVLLQSDTQVVALANFFEYMQLIDIEYQKAL
ncbi:hypothetical protein KIPB_007768 [Kipferlia bialata]|uniref:Uncharacterized protein n=1 Tax=Kipferlia bialata TaxID=797122 RepID=A0A9K3D0J1_9EUKA|nr:hypothetical protein KIPB_007768 [Kipferlia bialata]|eukprot:g7768.t1